MEKEEVLAMHPWVIIPGGLIMMGKTLVRKRCSITSVCKARFQRIIC